MMNPEIKKEWVAALKSRAYQKIKGDLKAPEGYCCLGVLTDLYCKAKSEEWEDALKYVGENEEGVEFERVHDDGDLPPKVVAWSGIGVADPYCGVGRFRSIKYTSHNDGIQTDALDFQAIADLIEQDPDL